MRPTKNQLLACQLKNTKGRPEPFLIWIYRKISVRITKYIARTFLTPNQISLMGFFSAFIAAYLFSHSSLRGNIFGIIFMHLSQVFDCVDGEIARLKNMESKFGYWLDGMAVKTGEIVLYFGLAFGYDSKFFKNSASLFFTKDIRFIWIFLAILIGSRFLVVTANEALHLLPKHKYRQIIKTPRIFTKGVFKHIKNEIINYGTQTTYLLITFGVLLNQIPLLFFFLITVNISVFSIISLRLYKFKK